VVIWKQNKTYQNKIFIYILRPLFKERSHATEFGKSRAESTELFNCKQVKITRLLYFKLLQVVCFILNYFCWKICNIFSKKFIWESY